MTAYEVRAYMSKAWKIDKELKAKYNALEEMRSMAEKATVSFSGMPGMPQGNSSRVEHYAIKLVEAQQDMEECVGNLLDIRSRIQKMIELAEDPLQRAALTEYHLNGRTAEQTADCVGYSLSQVWRLMNGAYERIAEKLTRNDME